MTNSGIQIALGVSTTHYTGKCSEWGKLRYTTHNLDINGLVEKIKQGYCFTHTFNSISADGTWGCKEKTIKNFKSTSTIFIDVDNSSITATNFFASVSPQPTILYTTPSNIDGEKNRFRLIYVYECHITDNETYRHEVAKISKSIQASIPDFTFDSTSVNVSQQMGGNGSENCLLLTTQNTFNFSSFPEYEDCTSTTYKKKRENDIRNRSADSYEEKDVEIEDEEFIKNFWRINDEDSVISFIRTYYEKYPLYDVTQVDEDTPYIALNDEYIEIARRYYITTDDQGRSFCHNVKIKEGSRERILFSNALLRLKINPEMKFENLLLAMVYERHFWIDNSDGEFTNKVIYKIAKGAFIHRDKYNISSATQGQLRKRARTNKNGLKVNKAYCYKHDISVRTMANFMRGDISNNTLLENYDFEKSVAENSQLLKAKGIKPNSERRLYQFKKWCIDNNIDIK